MRMVSVLYREEMIMKKVLAIVVSITMIMVMFASCGGSGGGSSDEGSFKVGLICLHDENSTYDLKIGRAHV